MKTVGIGVLAAIIALGLFFSGFLVGANVAVDSNSGYIKYLNETAKHSESAQMQCIHWVEQWQSASTIGGSTGPTFGMFTDLCGKPSTR